MITSTHKLRRKRRGYILKHSILPHRIQVYAKALTIVDATIVFFFWNIH